MSRAAKCFLMLAIGAILAAVAGCSTDEPQNADMRPWNKPQSWESGLPIDMGQHP